MAFLPIPPPEDVDVSCCDTLPGLRFRSIVSDMDVPPGPNPPVLLVPVCWVCCDGLRRSEGLRRVRKLWDFALRIFGRPEVEEGPFNLC